MSMRKLRQFTSSFLEYPIALGLSLITLNEDWVQVSVSPEVGLSTQPLCMLRQD